jgi:hypothetical protein
MPFTFAHPAAVLPLRKYCPKLLNLPALVVGSLMPDFGYYVHNWIWSISGHAFTGTLTFDIPWGLFVLSVFYMTIRPVARLLPYPHREACSAICPVVALPSIRSILVASYSLLIGAWSHIIWDGFTHGNGWCVRHFATATPALFTLGTYKVTIWHVLQHGSSILGLALLMMAYSRYAHSRRFLRHQSLLGPLARTSLWCLLLTLPAVRAVLDNITLLSRGITFPGMDDFIFNATVSYCCALLPMVCMTGIVVSLLEYLFLSRPATEIPVRLPETPSLAAAAPGKRHSIVSVLSAPSESMPLPVESLSKQATI